MGENIGTFRGYLIFTRDIKTGGNIIPFMVAKSRTRAIELGHALYDDIAEIYKKAGREVVVKPIMIDMVDDGTIN